jgi:hypothetical protein
MTTSLVTGGAESLADIDRMRADGLECTIAAAGVATLVGGGVR